MVYAASSNGSPHFINVGGGAYAPGGFAIVIWGQDLARFDTFSLRQLVEWSKSGQTMGFKVRASGVVEMYDERPQIVARDGSQVASIMENGSWFTTMSEHDIDALMNAIYQ